MNQPAPSNQILHKRLANKLELLESLAQISFARLFLKKEGFATEVSWEATKLAIKHQESGKGKLPKVANSMKKLDAIAKKLMIVGKQYFQVQTMETQDHKDLLSLLMAYKVPQNVYTKGFPNLLDSSALTSANMPVLSDIHDDSHGLAFIFSTPRLETKKFTHVVNINGVKKSATYYEDVKHHCFDVVYIPKSRPRIELRVSTNTVGKRQIEDALYKLQDAFYNILGQLNFSLTKLTTTNMHKAVENLYAENGYGKVIDTKFLSVQNHTLIPRANKVDTAICLRDQPYHIAGAKKEKVRCVGLTLHWGMTVKGLNLKNKTRLNMESEANFNYEHCARFTIETPLGNKKALELVDKILTVNK